MNASAFRLDDEALARLAAAGESERVEQAWERDERGMGR